MSSGARLDRLLGHWSLMTRCFVTQRRCYCLSCNMYTWCAVGSHYPHMCRESAFVVRCGGCNTAQLSKAAACNLFLLNLSRRCRDRSDTHQTSVRLMKLANFVVVLYLYATPCSFRRASSLGFSSSGSGCRNHALR